MSLVGLIACGGGNGSGSFFQGASLEETASGLKYRFHQQNPKGRKAKKGEFIDFHLIIQNYKDSVLSDQQFKEHPFAGTFFANKHHEIFEQAAEGDSLTFWVKADSLKNKSGYLNTPAIPSGTEIKYTLKINKIQSQAEITQKLQEQLKSQREIDEQLIDKYLLDLQSQDSTLQFEKDTSGIRYYFSKLGGGKKPAMGDTVSVVYISKLLDGTVYDRSNAPTDFVLGQMHIQLDQGILLMQEGTIGTFILPSELGYRQGTMGGAIPPNAILIFDIELIEIK